MRETIVRRETFQKGLSESQNKLNIRNEILKNKRNELEIVQKKEDSIRYELQKTTSEIQHAKANIKESQNRGESLENDIQSLQKTIIANKKEGEIIKNQLNEEIVSVQELERIIAEIKVKINDKDKENSELLREINQVAENHDNLLDNHYNLNKQITALKEHASTLETQNNTVFFYSKNAKKS